MLLLWNLFLKASYRFKTKRVDLTVEWKFVEFHEFKERAGDESRLADGGQACWIVPHAHVKRRLEFADCILNVQLRTPVIVPLNLFFAGAALHRQTQFVLPLSRDAETKQRCAQVLSVCHLRVMIRTDMTYIQFNACPACSARGVS